MSDCERCREWISESLDRRLAAPEMERLAAHLAGCPDCRRAHEEMDAGDALLRRIVPVPLPAGFEERVLAHASTAAPLPARRFGWTGALASGAAAAVLLGILAVILVMPPRGIPESARPAVAEQVPGAGQLVDSIISGATMEQIATEVKFLELEGRTEELQRHAAKSPELAKYVVEIQLLLKCIEEKNLQLTQAQARQKSLTAALQKLVQVEAAPHTPATYLVRGRARAMNGDAEGALRDYDQAIALDPHASHALYFRAQANRSRGHYADAIADYTTALRASSEPSARAYLALAVKDAGRTVDLEVNGEAVACATVESIAASDVILTLLHKPDTVTFIAPEQHTATTAARASSIALQTREGFVTGSFKVKTLKDEDRARLETVYFLRRAIERCSTQDK